MKMETLKKALSAMLAEPIVRADFQAAPLHGGTLGDVRLVSGMAQTAGGEKLPYRAVLKTQQKWERPGDPFSWRREYDLYSSDLYRMFPDSFRPPRCFYTEIKENEMWLWLEYIDGVSGKALTLGMLEQAARKLGRFQGRSYREREALQKIACLGDTGYTAREHARWHTQTYSYDYLISPQCRLPVFLKRMLERGEIRLCEGKSFEYSFLRSAGCDLPAHLKRMLIDADDQREELFERTKRLPVVLCHRDFWSENIFFSNGEVRLIDWDTAGWGYAGEDIASLIADETDAELIRPYYERLIPAYRDGLKEHIDILPGENFDIRERMLLKFGYRLLQDFMFTQDPETKGPPHQALQAMYEIGG